MACGCRGGQGSGRQAVCDTGKAYTDAKCRLLSCVGAEGDRAGSGRRELLEEMWRGRLRGAQKNVEVWQALLSVRSLVLPLHQDSHTWLKFASLARKSGRFRLASSAPFLSRFSPVFPLVQPPCLLCLMLLRGSVQG